MGSEEECNSSEESFEDVDNVRPINGDTEQHSKVPDSPTMVEETQETFSSNFNKHEDEQETVSTQSFIRNLFSETKFDDRASAFQLTKNRVSLKRLIDAE